MKNSPSPQSVEHSLTDLKQITATSSSNLSPQEIFTIFSNGEHNKNKRLSIPSPRSRKSSDIVSPISISAGSTQSKASSKKRHSTHIEINYIHDRPKCLKSSFLRKKCREYAGKTQLSPRYRLYYRLAYIFYYI